MTDTANPSYNNIMEIFKDIPNYDGVYKISRTGNVWSSKKGRLLKPCIGVRGYMVVNLQKKIRPIHQLVAETFLDDSYKEKLLVVDHIDRDKTNNNLSNLRVTNKSVNGTNSDRHKYKGHIQVRGENSFRAIWQRGGRRETRTFNSREYAQRWIDLNHTNQKQEEGRLSSV